MQKYVSWAAIAVFVLGVLALVYIFMTKGYSGIQKIIPVPSGNLTDNMVDTNSSTKETGNVTSNKISLVVTSPKAGNTLNSTSVIVTGKTTANADVFVNDQEGKADKNGNFSVSINLEEGDNQLVVSANDSEGNVAEESLSVTVSTFQ